MIGDDPWLLDLNLYHRGLRWEANPLKLHRQPDGQSFVGDVARHSEIGPWCAARSRSSGRSDGIAAIERDAPCACVWSSASTRSRIRTA
jgi:hypothetical protein